MKHKKQFKSLLSGIVVLLLKLTVTMLYAQEAQQHISNSKNEHIISAHIQDKNTIGNYIGGQTITPLTSAIMIRPFGVHTDLVYHIKVFHNSIILKPTKDTDVRAVFDGKVLFAGKKNGFGYVVILEHTNQLRTIYIGLEHINSTIRKGVLVKEASKIGEVSHELNFQVVQDSKYIDPISIFLKKYRPLTPDNTL